MLPTILLFLVAMEMVGHCSAAQRLSPASPGDNHIVHKVREEDILAQHTAQHSTTQHYAPANTLHTHTPVPQAQYYNTIITQHTH